jgi:hypothetical protein
VGPRLFGRVAGPGARKTPGRHSVSALGDAPSRRAEIKNCERRSAREAGCKVFREVAQGATLAELARSYDVGKSTISRLTVAT